MKFNHFFKNEKQHALFSFLLGCLAFLPSDDEEKKEFLISLRGVPLDNGIVSSLSVILQKSSDETRTLSGRGFFELVLLGFSFFISDILTCS